MIKKIVLSGVVFRLVTKDDPALAHLQETRPVWGPWLLVGDVISKADVFIGAGYNWSKIDSAIPQSFWDEQCAKYEETGWEHHHPNNFVWSYEMKAVFGEAVHINDAWGSLIVRLATQLEDEYLASLTKVQSPRVATQGD